MMSDSIVGVSGTPLAAGGNAVAGDDTALAEQFATALLEGGVFLMGTLISDAAEAAQDSSGDLDAPF